MDKIRLGFALTGSFCTLERVLDILSELCPEKYDIYPILSENTMSCDTRFMTRQEILDRLALITPNMPIRSIKEAEPIGPRKLLDALVVAPCTGNTLAKLANGITDSSVTMAAKAHLRNERPLIIAPSSNDALSANLKNIGLLMNTKNVYFVPFSQDDPTSKHRSVISHFELIEETVDQALNGLQKQPIILCKKRLAAAGNSRLS